MIERTTLVIATRNPGKTAEIRQMLEGYPVTVKNLDDFGPIPEIPEDGETFDENAYKKASFASRVLGFPAMADDSGLCVNTLNGQPGVHSARFAGSKATDADKCAKLLEMLKNAEDRSAAFVCVISIAVPTGAALTYEGRCEGAIAQAPAGENGFGYDPVFYYPPLEKTFAQLTAEEKNRVSHRGRALTEVRDEFDRILKWIDLQIPVAEKFSANYTNQ
ncbi:MAG: XTP/dITP diphosphatase [Desulfobacterales bacterium]|nr:XTP/dITP diphosphatase [Desulfobacterales bacterium]MBS3756602.1 XTP/dITP diphosphatase [Desulfobacterales bacterium]